MKLCYRCGEPFNNDSASTCSVCGHEPPTLDGHLAFAPELAHEGAGFEASYFDTLSKLEPGNFWFGARNKLLIWALRRYFPQASSFLEIGCGTGFVLAGIGTASPHLALYGSEVFAAGLAIAARRVPRAELFQMDARRIPFIGHFDVIGAFDVLEHITEDEQVLSQMRQAVRKGGGILITVPQHRFLWSQSDDYARHVRRYAREDLKKKAENAGFEVLRVTSFVSLLLPLMFAMRAWQRAEPEFDPTTEFRISPAANMLLERIMDVERTWIRAGLSFPAGGSLLMAARAV
jgi:SAM-dependent methyltransferase